MTDLKIIPAEEKDIPLILNFIKKLAEYEKLTDQVTATEENLRQTLFGDKKYAEAVIAYYKNEPAGFALFFHNYSTFMSKPGLYLEDLLVLEEMRGKGIGKAIFEYLINLAKERNCGRFEWSVLDWNKPAIDFYKKFGASPMDEWTVFRLDKQTMDKL